MVICANESPSHLDKAAVIVPASSRVLTYRELEASSNQIARLFGDMGLRYGDNVAICIENRSELLEVAWAAQRSGLYYSVLSTRLLDGELGYILKDCGAKVVVGSAQTANALGAALKDNPQIADRFSVDAETEGWRHLYHASQGFSTLEIPGALEGSDMLYSSGTTGRPKGVKTPLTGEAFPGTSVLVKLLVSLYGFDEAMIYLSPAPLYHAAPLRFCMSTHRLGGTVVVMDHFDPLEYLQLAQDYHVTHSQLVPTMFIKMLKLDASLRAKYDLSSIKAAIHAAAPCPIPIKREMLEWWGPVIHEYYAGTEGNGFLACSPTDWLAHPGSVGKSLVGEVHILDEEGQEAPVGSDGTIYFANGGKFEYHNDREKTLSVHNDAGWSTLGDIGHLDKEGFLYLTDRKSFMIISGGVNIYPQEAESVLITHPAVADVAVIGVPNDLFGEEVKAVVQLIDPAIASAELEADLIAFCRSQLADLKCPRSVDFRDELPRMPTGKLYKRLLRDEYWAGHTSRII